MMKQLLISAWRLAAGLRSPSRRGNLRRLRASGHTLESIRIREATAADIPAIVALHVRTWNETYAPLLMKGPNSTIRERQWREEFDGNDATWFCYVAERADGALVGFAQGNRSDYPEFAGQLNKIYLLRDYQRLGFGRCLIGYVARRFRSLGFNSMWLFGDARNPARRVWITLGATKTDDDPGTGNYGWRDLAALAALPDESSLRDTHGTPTRTIGHRLGAILDPERTVAVAAAAAWLAFMAGLVVGDDVEGAADVAVAGVLGGALVVVGFAAASRCRVLVQHPNRRWVRLCGLSLATGAGVGLVNLAANRGIAEADPALRTLVVERMARLDPRPWETMFGGPIIEEVVFRLFVMSVIAWVAYRVTKRAKVTFVVALIGSAVLFAVPHLERPIPDDPMLADFYRAALMTKYTLLGVPLGWIFWRWGLPYAILCHSAANATHMVVGSVVF